MIVQAKKVWEQLRRGDISRDEQKALMAKMMNIIGGKVQDVKCLICLLSCVLYGTDALQSRLFSSTMLPV